VRARGKDEGTKGARRFGDARGATRRRAHRAVSVARGDGFVVVGEGWTTRRSISSEEDACLARSATISRTLTLSKDLAWLKAMKPAVAMA